MPSTNTVRSVRKHLNGNASSRKRGEPESVTERAGALLSEHRELAWVLVPLAAIALFYPRQTLKVVTRIAMAAQAFELGMELRERVGKWK